MPFKFSVLFPSREMKVPQDYRRNILTLKLRGKTTVPKIHQVLMCSALIMTVTPTMARKQDDREENHPLGVSYLHTSGDDELHFFFCCSTSLTLDHMGKTLNEESHFFFS